MAFASLACYVVPPFIETESCLFGVQLSTARVCISIIFAKVV